MGAKRAATAWLLAGSLGAALLLSGCADLASSTGSDVDRVVDTAHTQVQTVGVVAEAGLHHPAPVPTLTVVLDDAHTDLVEAGSQMLSLPPGETGRNEALALVEDALDLVEHIRRALRNGDRGELRDLGERATALAGELREQGGLL